MEFSDAITIVAERILKLEPEIVTKKIIHFMRTQKIPEQEIVLLARGSDALIYSFIQKAKTAILSSTSPVSIPNLPLNGSKQFIGSVNPVHPFYTGAASFSAPAAYQRVDGYGLQSSLMSLEDQMQATKLTASGFPNGYYSNQAALNNLDIKWGRSSSRLVNFPVKTCHYFSKGFCKHGSNCRYFHDETVSERFDHMFGPNPYELTGDDQVISPQCLEKLEHDITELLKSQRGIPVSIASLPMMYFEKYGRMLQAEGYLTESQRHGKAGYSLTKLLARLKRIRLIDRPHGQHAVILAEDAQKYMEIRGERNDLGPIASGGRQIYLTFPSESTFSEEEVAEYFSTFGPVEDVRIPAQQERMFGFVCFVNADTVNLVLSEKKPHFVCGARVLVKPYREKSKAVEKNYHEKIDHPMYYQPHPIDIGAEEARCERQVMELEHERKRQLLQLHLERKIEADPPCFSLPMFEMKVPTPDFLAQFIYGVPSSGSTGDENPKSPVNNCGDQESSVEGHTLPESPHASDTIEPVA